MLTEPAGEKLLSQSRCRVFRIALIFIQLVCCRVTVAQLLERWVYVPANLLVDDEVARVKHLLRESRELGFTHILLSDSKFCRLHEMEKRYFDHVAGVRQLAADIGMHIVPTVFPVGYSNDLLSQNPNLAEGLPVRDALFEVQEGIARLVPDPQVGLPAFSSRSEWDFVDATLQSDGDVLAAVNPVRQNCRAMKSVRVAPFRHYHVSVQVRTQDFRGQPQINVLEPETGRRLSHTNLQMSRSQDWSTQHITFNSLSNTAVNIYIGAWGASGGRMELRDPLLEECGLLNILRRDGTPLRVQQADAPTGVLTEGVDFEPVHDDRLGSVPWPGEYEVWHDAPVIRMKGIWQDGTHLRVSWYHPHVIHDGQVCGCVTEPQFQELLWQQAEALEKLFPATDRMMSHDEWRVMGWDESFRGVGRTPAQVAAVNVRECSAHLKALNAARRILVWSDMFDPHHNAVDNYYLVNGDLSGSWQGLDPEVIIMNWNFPVRTESLQFFADRGHHQILAGYYDADAEQIGQWLETVKRNGIPRIIGVMYTTWKQDYSHLREFAHVVDRFDKP